MALSSATLSHDAVMPSLPDRPFAISMLLGIVAVALGQLLSPFHLLTHTFTVAATVVATLLLAGWSTTRQTDAEQTVGHGVVAVVAGGLGIHGAMALTNLGWHDCDPSGTAAFFWVTWAPLTLGGVAFGTAVRTLRWPLRIGLLLLIVGLTLAHDGVQAVLGVRVLDPLIGDPLFLDQRADLQLPMVHVMSRAWLLLGAVAWCARLVWTVGIGRRVANVLLVVFTALTLLGGGTTGIGLSRAARDTELDTLRETAHFRLRYRADGPVAGRIDRIAEEAEYQWTELTQWLGVEHPVKVDIQLFDDTDALWRVTGIRNAHAGYRSMNIHWWDALDSTFPHELVHTLHAELSWNPRILLSTGLIEGTAMAWDHGYGWNRDAHVDIAAAHKAGHLPSASLILSATGFTTLNESNAYRFAGSFIGFLVLEHGMQAFLDYQRSLDPVAAFGHDLDALDRQWRVFLDGIEVPAEDQSRARDRFDPVLARGVFANRCPKLGTRVPSLEARAHAMGRHGDPAGAASAYQALHDATGHRRWLFAATQAYQKAELPAEALAMLDRLADDAPPDVRARALQARINATLLLAVQLDAEPAWSSLYEHFAERRVLEDPSRERQSIERLLRRPFRSSIGAVLLQGEAEGVDRVVTALLEEHPGDEDLADLRVSRGLVWPRSRTGRADPMGWERALTLVELHGTCPEVRDAETVLARFLDEHRLDLASRWITIVDGPCAATLPHHVLVRLRSRARAASVPGPVR